MKKLALLFFILSCSLNILAQKSLIPKFVQKMYFNKDTSRRKSFVVLPVLSSAPETGIEAGGAGLLSFYTDTADKSTKISEMFVYGTITTKGQNRLSLKLSYWAPQNTIHYRTSVGFINFPFNFYGLGNNTHLADVDHVGEKRYKFTFGAEKSVGGNIYAGFVLGGYNFAYSDNNPTGIFNSDPYIQNKSGGSSLYIGPSLNYDSRNNNTYTTKGIVITSNFNLTKGVLGNNSYTGGFFNIEYSQFFALNKKLVFGLDLQEQSLTGNRSPFYFLPQLGNDEIMRGYYGGRYRDRNLLVGQAELRYRFIPSLAIVGFVGTGEVFNTAFSMAQLKPNYGGGIRYFFDVVKGLSVRMDYGVGEKPAGEPRESGFYIGLGQAF